MRVAWFPKASDLSGNPYWALLHRELKGLDIEFETSHNSYWMTYRWLWDHRRMVDLLHFHFMEPHYAGEEGCVSVWRLCKFAGYLALARSLGYRIVWTMHEDVPTWPMTPKWLEQFGRTLMAWSANAVIVHCGEARRILARRFRRSRRVYVLPVPSYADVYPNDITRSEARGHLGLEQARLVLTFFGGIRPNKGVDRLIEALAQLPGDDIALIVAGTPFPPPGYVERIQLLAASDPRVLLKAERVPDDEVQLYVSAADVLVFPFEHVLTSASVVLAMSFARPVIVPALGCLPELVGDHAGFVYDPRTTDGLKNALEKAMEADLVSMGAAAAKRVSAATWQDLARHTARVYGA